MKYIVEIDRKKKFLNWIFKKLFIKNKNKTWIKFQVNTYEYMINKKIEKKICEWNIDICKKDLLILGKTKNNKTLDVKYKATNNCNMLVAGMVGSGKSVMLRNLAFQAYINKCKLFTIDFKGGIELSHFDSISENEEAITTREEVIVLLDNLKSMLKSRMKLIKGAKKTNIFEVSENEVPIVVLIDELAEITDVTGLNKEEKEKTQKIIGDLSTIMRLGRAVGFNVIAGTQYPTADILNSQIKRNFGVRICGLVDGSTASRVVLEQSGAEELENAGEFLVSYGKKKLEFINGFYQTTDQLSSDINKIKENENEKV